MKDKLNPAIDVVAGIVIHRGKILITQRKKGAHLGLMWEFPGGKIHTGETEEEALHRELKEELGIKIKDPSLFLKTSHSYDDRRVRLMFFLCRLEHGSNPKTLQVRQFHWVSKTDLSRFVFPPANQRLIELLQNSAEL